MVFIIILILVKDRLILQTNRPGRVVPGTIFFGFDQRRGGLEAELGLYFGKEHTGGDARHAPKPPRRLDAPRGGSGPVVAPTLQG